MKYVFDSVEIELNPADYRTWKEQSDRIDAEIKKLVDNNRKRLEKAGNWPPQEYGTT